MNKVDEAIELLKAMKAVQPEPGEFTNKIKEESQGYSQDAQYSIKRLCNRLDDQQKQIERLETLSDAYKEKTERLDAAIDLLIAENDRLETLSDAQQKEIDCYRLRKLSAEKGWKNAQIELDLLTAENQNLKQKYAEYTTGTAKYYHDVWCNASREKPMGCSGCSCTIGKELQANAEQFDEKDKIINQLNARLDAMGGQC